MNFYQERLKELDRNVLPSGVFGSGDISKRNKYFIEKLQKGDKVFPTAWFLRNIYDINIVKDIAANGLTFKCVTMYYDENLHWEFGRWRGGNVESLEFEEDVQFMSGRNCFGQYIWKIERNGKVIYKVK